MTSILCLITIYGGAIALGFFAGIEVERHRHKVPPLDPANFEDWP